MTSDPLGGETTRFQPHRQDGKRAGVTRQTRPSIFFPTIALIFLSIGTREVPDMGLGLVDGLIWGVLTGIAAGVFVSWLNQMFRWTKDR